MKLITYLGMIMLFIYISTLSFAQKKDSLLVALNNTHDTTRVNVLINLGLEYKSDSLDSAEYYLQKAIFLANKLSYNKGSLLSLGYLADVKWKQGNANEAINLYTEAIQKSREFHNKIQEGRNLQQLGKLYHGQSNYAQALMYFNTSKQLYELLNDQSAIAESLNFIGMIYDDQGDYVKALENYLKAYEIDEKLGNTEYIPGYLNNIAIIYKKQEQTDLALEYYLKALKMSENEGDEISSAITKVNIALVHKDARQFDQAIHMMDESLEVFEQDNDKQTLAIVYHNFGEIYKAKGDDHHRALDYLIRSISYAEEIGLKKVLAKNYASISEIYNEIRRHELALLNAKESFRIAEEIGSLEEIQEASLILSKFYSNSNEHEQALKYHQIFTKAKDSLFNESKSKLLSDVQAKFDFSQKEKEIEFLEKQNELQKVVANKEQNFNYVLIFGLILLLSLTGLAAFSFRNKLKTYAQLEKQKEEIDSQKKEIKTHREDLLKKNKALETLNKEKDEIIGIVAHDLRNPLTQVKGLISIVKATGSNLNNEQNQCLDTALQSTDRLNSMITRILDVQEIESKKLNLQLETFDLSSTVKTVVDDFKQMSNAKKIDIKTHLERKDCIIKADKSYTVQVIENLISNALKFSPMKCAVEVKVSRPNGRVRTEIIDQGPGLSEADKSKLFLKFQKLSARPTNNEKSTGLGLAIVKKYVEAMEGKVWCESKLGKGSNFIVEFEAAKKS
ncbi:tetratricopeptide repeat protein [Fulvivirgaceae bacterium BMA10]|uniref:histidine kinase n=1 Tax=Splendidivirga corallicola TaxID=3051826 RepID=A0ABT8KJG6_9BACT|nr:tetratricopeptide repeat protein [Fulvivirgaceae bacterium BMA10]